MYSSTVLIFGINQYNIYIQVSYGYFIWIILIFIFNHRIDISRFNTCIQVLCGYFVLINRLIIRIQVSYEYFVSISLILIYIYFALIGLIFRVFVIKNISEILLSLLVSKLRKFYFWFKLYCLDSTELRDQDNRRW